MQITKYIVEVEENNRKDIKKMLKTKQQQQQQTYAGGNDSLPLARTPTTTSKQQFIRATINTTKCQVESIPLYTSDVYKLMYDADICRCVRVFV